MNANLENKTPGLNNHETYILTHFKFITYMVVVFTDLNKAQIYKMPYRDSLHHEIEILMSFDYLHLFRPNEHTEDYKTMQIFYSKLKIKNIFIWEQHYLVLKQTMKE